MFKPAAAAFDETGFLAIHAFLGLQNRHHQPAREALDRLREHGSPIVTAPDETPPAPEVTIEAVEQRDRWSPTHRFSFPSPLPSPRPENNTVHVDLFCPDDGWGTGIVLMCPGVLTGAKGMATIAFWWWGHYLRSRNLTCALVHPPYHMRRTPAGLLSGELMFCGDVFTSAQGYAQAVADLRVATSWALTVTPRVAYWGVSMGGIIGLGLVAREPRLTCCVAVEPSADIVSSGYRSSFTSVIRQDFSLAGGTPADMHALCEPLSPFKHPPVIARDRLLLLEAQHDQVCFADDLERLWESWNRPPILRYPYGHLSMPASLRARRDAANFLLDHLTGPPVVALPTPEPAQLAA